LGGFITRFVSPVQSFFGSRQLVASGRLSLKQRAVLLKLADFLAGSFIPLSLLRAGSFIPLSLLRAGFLGLVQASLGFHCSA